MYKPYNGGPLIKTSHDINKKFILKIKKTRKRNVPPALSLSDNNTKKKVLPGFSGFYWLFLGLTGFDWV